ncbi:hypothetical protein [Flagellimonas iocasae]|uniref:Oligosaccharide repeat unit polymerase n=1 Tax=Flagellimonas iocasae TaxID=2055905 RepID=A0ABW4XYS2_9FLAO
MKTIIKHNRKNVLFLELIVFLLISLVYNIIIKDVFDYMGFIGEPIFHKLLIGTVVFLVLVVLGATIKDPFFYAVWHISFLIFIIGQIVYYQYSNGLIGPLIGNTIFLLVLYVFSFIKLNIRKVNVKGKPLNIILVSTLLLFFPIFIRYSGHVNFNNFLLQDIYESRLYFREFDDKYFGYLRAPLSRVILPSLLIIGLLGRKVWLVVLSLFMISFIFLVGALKSIFIGMIAAILFYLGKTYLDKVYIMLYLFFFLTFFGLLVFWATDNVFLVDSLVRRTLFVPAMLDNYYYEIFADNQLYWSHNFLGELFFNYPFDRPPNMFVGEVILQKEGMSANVGIVTEGFFSLGYLGIFLESMVIAFIFLLLKSIKIKPVFFGLVFVYIYYINTSFLSVLMLTHGLIFFLFFAFLFLNKDYEG